MKLYLDMDGVLIDFDAEIVRRGIVNDKTFLHLPRQQWTPAQHLLSKQVYSQMNLDDFWRALGPTPDAHQLWDFCRPYQPDILTAVPPRELNPITDIIHDAKLRSIWSNFDPLFPANRVHFCRREEKIHKATAGAVLIDDMVGNCQEWIAAGGHAILHTSAADSIAQLQELLNALD